MTLLAAHGDPPLPRDEDRVHSSAKFVLLRRDAEYRLARMRTAGAALEDIERLFRSHADRWREETAVLSSATEMIQHPAYQAIIDLGELVLPLILREQAEDPDHWGPALSAITHENPVPPEHHGDIAAIAADWVRWGRSQRLLR
jgi:hypothetical protein